MFRWVWSGAICLTLAGVMQLAGSSPSSAARYSVGCAAPNGPWCRIYCTSNRGVACYANVVNGRCVKVCRYR
jgi:hypothetical protein